MLGFTIYMLVGIGVLIGIVIHNMRDIWLKCSYLEVWKLVKANLKGKHGVMVQFLTILSIGTIIIDIIFWPVLLICSWYRILREDRG